MYLQAYSKSAVPVVFNPSQSLNSQPSTRNSQPLWGMDTAWDSSDNVTRGTNYIGKDVLSVGRVSFQPSDLVDSNGNLSSAQKSRLQSRLNHIAISGVRNIILNCDHEALNSANYYGKPYEWYRVIKASVLYAKSKGFNVVTVSPFNEPDYSGWGEGTQAHFKEICRYISEDKEMAGIRISAGNTLNSDQALSWYNYMKPYVSEGCTHQLAGSFDTYSNFFKTVRNDGNHATADEMHNVGDAIVGLHYGLQTGIWWGWDGLARGEFCRDSYYGAEIGYGENRNAWTAAAVFKYTDREKTGVRAFLGSSERQATTSAYEFVSSSRPVYYDGVGPVNNFSIQLPGGTGYQKGQSNAERMIQIHYGEDVPAFPLAAGTYVIMNVNSMKCIGYYNGAKGNGVNLAQGTYSGTKSNTHQRWLLRPVPSTVGGDFSYFYLKSERDSTQLMDLKNWSTSAGGDIIAYSGSGGAIEQWYAEYAGNGNYYIRSRHSGLYLEIRGAKTTNNAYLQQAEFSGTANQQWRFMPTDAALELTPPTAPQGVSVIRQAASNLITWQPVTTSDMAGYMVYRDSDCIGRMIDTTAFLDNACIDGAEHEYKIKAIDKSGNLSPASSVIITEKSDYKGLLLHYSFDQTTSDYSENQLDASFFGTASYNTIQKKIGTHSLKFDGVNNYLLLPSSVGDMSQATISFWAYNSSSTTARQRFFDFGNDDKHYMYLTPNNGSSMCLAIRNGDEEQTLTAQKFTTFGWHHFAVTMPSRDSQAEHDSQVSLYIDGELVASSTDISLRPSDIHSVRNYVGRSQSATDPLFKGYLDEFRIYNYALSASEVAILAGKEVLLGDANNDGIVNVNDITLTATYILDNSLTNINKVAADSNKDGIINVNDITTTAKIILN